MQMMWMGSGIAAAPPAVMFPGVHQYLPRMGVGMGPAAAMPSMPRLPFMAAPQPVVPANAQVNVNPVPGYRSHHLPAAAVGITEPYGHYLGINHLQPPPSQLQVQVRRVPCLPPSLFLYAVCLTSLGSTTRRAWATTRRWGRRPCSSRLQSFITCRAPVAACRPAPRPECCPQRARQRQAEDQQVRCHALCSSPHLLLLGSQVHSHKGSRWSFQHVWLVYSIDRNRPSVYHQPIMKYLAAFLTRKGKAKKQRKANLVAVQFQTED